MGLLTALTVGGLNPDIDKKRFNSLLRKNNIDTYGNEFILSDNIKNHFLLNHQIATCEALILNQINVLSLKNQEIFNGKKLNSITVNNAYKIITALPPSFLYFVKNESIYCSPFGTIIIDFQNEENIFSLEIAKNSIGYFIELDGTDELIEDSLSTSENNFEDTMTKLCHDFAIIL